MRHAATVPDRLPDGGTTPAGAAVLEVDRQARDDALRTAVGLTGLLTAGVLHLTARLPDHPVRGDQRATAPTAVSRTRGGRSRASVAV